jgi:hypothetical protein
MLAGQYDNSVPIRFLAPIDCSKIPDYYPAVKHPTKPGEILEESYVYVMVMTHDLGFTLPSVVYIHAAIFFCIFTVHILISFAGCDSTNTQHFLFEYRKGTISIRNEDAARN